MTALPITQRDAAESRSLGSVGDIVDAAIVASRDEYRRIFEAAEPFKAVVIEQFLTPEFAEQLLSDFPTFDPERARNEFNQVGGKAVNERIETISQAYRRLSEFVRSEHGTFYVQRPVPDRIRPGYVMTEADIAEVRELIAKRDAWLRHYQAVEIKVGPRIGEFEQEIAALKQELAGGVRQAFRRSLRYRLRQKS